MVRSSGPRAIACKFPPQNETVRRKCEMMATTLSANILACRHDANKNSKDQPNHTAAFSWSGIS